MKEILTAREAAFRDIAEECKKQKDGRNYLLFEDDILASLGIKKPDFRKFNGWRNKAPLRIYVTFHTLDDRGNRKDTAVACGSEEQVDECKKIAASVSSIRNVRVNRCGEIKNKSAMIISFDEFKNLIEL